MRHKYTFKHVVDGHEYKLANFRQTSTGFDADLLIDGEYCGPCSEKGFERNRMTTLVEKEMKTTKARMAYRGKSRRCDLKLIILTLSYEMADHGLNMSIPEQREARAEDRLTRELAQQKRMSMLLEMKVDELRNRQRSRVFRY